MLFLGIISWKGASLFSGGEEWVVFKMGDFIFKWGVHPIGKASVLMGGGLKKL